MTRTCSERHAEHLGDRLAVGIDALRMRPDGQPLVLHQRDGAGRSDRAVDLIGPGEGRLEHLRRRRCRATPLSATTPTSRSRLLQDGRQVGLVGQRRRSPPTAAAAASARIALTAWNSPSATTARKLPSRTTDTTPGIASTALASTLGQARAGARRAHDAGVQHAVQPQVVDVGDAAGHLGGNVDARQRLSHDAERAGLLQVRLRLRLDVQHLRRIRARRSSTERPPGPTIAPAFGLQFAGRDAKRRAASAIRISRTCAAAWRIAVPLFCIDWLPAVKPSSGVCAGVGGDQIDVARLDLQLFGRHLNQRGADALAELGLAGEDGDAPSASIRIQESRKRASSRLPGQLRRLRRAAASAGAASCAKRAKGGEADDQRAGPGEHAAAGDAELGCSGRMVISRPPSARRQAGRLHQLAGAAHRLQDARMRAAAAEIGLERRADLIIAGAGFD